MLSNSMLCRTSHVSPLDLEFIGIFDLDHPDMLHEMTSYYFNVPLGPPDISRELFYIIGVQDANTSLISSYVNANPAVRLGNSTQRNQHISVFRTTFPTESSATIAFHFFGEVSNLTFALYRVTGRKGNMGSDYIQTANSHGLAAQTSTISASITLEGGFALAAIVRDGSCTDAEITLGGESFTLDFDDDITFAHYPLTEDTISGSVQASWTTARAYNACIWTFAGDS